MEIALYGLIVCVLALCVALKQRFKAESSLAYEVYKLDDVEKKYVSMVLNKSRIELNEQNNVDAKSLQKLVDAEWLYVHNDGVIVADHKAEYLSKKIKCLLKG
jgi:predicted HTH transcriptional regulator